MIVKAAVNHPIKADTSLAKTAPTAAANRRITALKHIGKD